LKPILRLGLVACLCLSASALSAEEQKRQRPAAPVELGQVKQLQISPTVMVSGTVWSQQEAAVPAEVDGRLVWVAEVGTQIRWGDPVAKLDDTMFRLRVAENRAALKRDTARLNYLDNELKRIHQLSKQEFAAKSQLDKMQLDRDVVASELSVSRAKLAVDEEQLKRFTVRAPFAGVVINRSKREGEWVTSGNTVVNFSNPSSLEVRAHVPVESVGFIKVGQRVDVQQGNQRSTGVVRTLVPLGDQQSLLFDVAVAVEGAQWRGGQTVRLSVPVGDARQEIVIPRDALILRRTGNYVYRVGEDKTAERVDVETGIASGDLIAVKGQLKAGDKIVLRGGERLRPGQTVNVIAGN